MGLRAKLTGLLLLLTSAMGAQNVQTAFGLEEAQSTISDHCAVCHQGDSAQAGLDLTRFTTVDEIVGERGVWEQVLRRVRDQEMPPPPIPGPDMEKREKFTAWLQETLQTAACADGVTPAPAPVRRLSRTEYTNTIRDLLNIQVNAGHALPADGAGGEGFDNAAETLFISPIHAERYVDAAAEALDYTFKSPRSRRTVLIEPGPGRTPAEAARQTLEGFLPRAFRRPASPHEVDRYLALYSRERKRDRTFDEAIGYALQAVLVSPQFLFRLEAPNPDSEPRPADDYALASRLSYFLWGSMPDENLFCLAALGELGEADVLDRQIAAMLEDEKSREFAESFTEQWLGIRELGRDIQPDPEIFPEYAHPDMPSAFRWEPILFFQEILAKDLSLLNIIDSDFTFLNRRLQEFYGLDVEKLRQQHVRVDLPEGTHRGGVLGMAAVLAVSSLPHRTSPVLRGKWVLESVLGTPPPPPPPNVPELDEEHDGATPTTLRARLEQHRANPVCASCHNRIDPIGFGLENYDVLGRWRSHDVAGLPIDSRGELTDGTTFEGPDGLKSVLLAKKDLFIRNLTAKMLGYALGRGLTAEDQCAVDQIVAALEENDYRAQTLIRGIVNSVPFRYQAGARRDLPVVSSRRVSEGTTP